MKQEYLKLEEVVERIVQKGVISKEVAETLVIPHWYNESPLEEDAPTQLFEDLVKLAGYKLKYYSTMENNLYWLEPLVA